MECSNNNPVLDKWNNIVATFHDKLQNSTRLSGGIDVTHDDTYNYLSFYFIHGGLFVVEDNGEIVGIMTIHPQKSDFNWIWKQENGECTVHRAWAKDTQAFHDLMFHGFRRFKPTKVFACRDGHVIELQPKKIERIISYGRRRNHNPSASATELRSIDEGSIDIPSRVDAEGVCVRAAIPA